MFKKHDRRPENRINAGSMADIAFLLLIFFLVTTTILVDTGIQVGLPPWAEAPPRPIPDRNVLQVRINAQNELFVEKGRAEPGQLRARAKTFIMNPGALSSRPSSPKRAVISLQHDRGTSYRAYLEVYNELIAAYQELWDEEARRRYQLPYKGLAASRQKLIRADIPLVISEAEPVELMAGN
ncbi:MAG: biopolymer transporter ExbD [Phaeodactylibacter sp.]|nr:biopolymer transporter ExbD [Phaeodactylibacter sp.]MCB9263874.1 biopolymer transporter ExbD [Lewinellaceae bacterium]MCB9288200.1 biopolymer transporter ExbD [Lewinellaceae bacterium]